VAGVMLKLLPYLLVIGEVGYELRPKKKKKKKKRKRRRRNDYG